MKHLTTEERRRRRFSNEFKRQVVDQIESGSTTVKAVSVLYQVKSDNVRKWLKKFGKKRLPQTILVTTPSEVNRVVDLEKEIDRLTRIIGEQQVKLICQDKLLEVYEEQYGSIEKK